MDLIFQMDSNIVMLTDLINWIIFLQRFRNYRFLKGEKIGDIN